MPKPQLFLLTPGYGESENQFCPDCALVEGFFVYQPALKAMVDFHYIAFTRPRAPLVQLLGEALQNSPALVFPEGIYPEGVPVADSGRAYLNDGRAICTWLGNQAKGLIPS
ncbi:DUF3088 family protein [Simiduia agarivorans]|uniref:DUF3088 family protein n=1 Tax=Simiduia agarivorans (strain DSM 21679 / JCM 13881 / BCRC 17597 / SA1) TaxID=1117647 RepID=K4KHI0_SIMAS|nr:DUF3088 family protein [Simiduia agarivorans]AFU98471.2 hypothetical protein M5M_06380 [Simiduia agarivorans SA1 = DSM 21679]